MTFSCYLSLPLKTGNPRVSSLLVCVWPCSIAKHYYARSRAHSICLMTHHHMAHVCIAWLCVLVTVYQIYLTLTKPLLALSLMSMALISSRIILNASDTSTDPVTVVQTFWLLDKTIALIKVRDVQVPLHVDDVILEGLWVMHLSFQCSDNQAPTRLLLSNVWHGHLFPPGRLS